MQLFNNASYNIISYYSKGIIVVLCKKNFKNTSQFMVKIAKNKKKLKKIKQ